MEVIVLGSGGAVPSKRHSHSCIALKHGGTFLFDCGENAQQLMLKHDASYGKLKAVFLTHLHADHWLGLPGLLKSMSFNGKNEELLITGPKGLKKLLSALMEIKYLVPAFKIVARELEAGDVAFEDDFLSIKAIKTEHSTPSIGYVIQEPPKLRFHEQKAKALGLKGRMFTEIREKKKLKVDGKVIKLADVTYLQEGRKIVYTGDTRPCESIVKASKNADLLIHESSFSLEDLELARENFHSTCVDAALSAKKANVKKLLLLHISSRYDSKRESLLKQAKELFENSILAEEGKVLEF